jgi:ribonuclease P protein component
VATAAPLVARGYALGLCAVHPGLYAARKAHHTARAVVHPATRPGLRRPRRKDACPKDIGPLTSDCAAPARLTLPAQRRLRRKSDFDAAYAGGRKFGNGFFGVTAFWNDKGWPRLGLAVSVRTAGGGVQRNRIRRIIRESFRLHQHELPGVDLIVSARSRAKDAPPPELHASLVALWKKVKEQCATSPRS